VQLGVGVTGPPSLAPYTLIELARAICF
jgi:hypothetical protein